MTQVCSAPAATFLMVPAPAGRAASTANELAMVSPLPRVPLRLLPQHHTSPFDLSAQACCEPTEICVTPVSAAGAGVGDGEAMPGTGVGRGDGTRSPLPRTLALLVPAHHTLPSLLRMQAKASPA